MTGELSFEEVLDCNITTLRMVRLLADEATVHATSEVNAIINAIPMEQRHNIIASDVVLLASLIRQFARATGREPGAIIDEIAGAFSLAITEADS